MYETIVLALIPTLIPAVFSYATVRMQTASKKATDELSEKVNKIQLKVDEITEIGKKNNSDIGVLNSDIGNLNSDIGNLKNDVSNLNKDIKNLKSDVKKMNNDVAVVGGGILETERYRLEVDLTAIIKRGYRTSDDTRRITALYKSYQSLGGNGYIEDLFKQFMKLPLKEM